MIKNEHLDHTTSQEMHEFNSSPTSWVRDYIVHHRLEGASYLTSRPNQESAVWSMTQ